jgi:hypothetical protein
LYKQIAHVFDGEIEKVRGAPKCAPSLIVCPSTSIKNFENNGGGSPVDPSRPLNRSASSEIARA